MRKEANGKRLSAAEPTVTERASAAWRRINLVGLDRRSVVASGVGRGHRLDEFIAGLLGNLRFNSHREKSVRCLVLHPYFHSALSGLHEVSNLCMGKATASAV